MKKQGSDHHDREIRVGSAPSEVPAPAADAVQLSRELPPSETLLFKTLTFDPREFMQYVEGEDLSEAEAAEFLRAIWDVMVAFIDMKIGISSIKQVVDRSREQPGPDSRAVLSSGETFSHTTNDRSGARARRMKSDL